MRQCPHCSNLFDDALSVCPEDGAPLGEPDRLLGTVLDGKYRIEAQLGSGGMGIVYRATQLALDRTVAVKILRTPIEGSEDLRNRFKREALLVARLNHPHIVTIHDYGIAANMGAYIVMEYIRGRSLAKELAQRRHLPPAEATALMIEICRAIDEAHAAGVIHRDIKPHNVMLEEFREGLRAKVLDFGIAKLWDEPGDDSNALTQAGALLGTPNYMSPEQFDGSRVDARSDVYSLGCLFFEMLTGRPPFTAHSRAAVMSKHLFAEPPPPSSRVPRVGPELDAIVLKALEKAPADRYPSVAALAGDLARAESLWSGTSASTGPESWFAGGQASAPLAPRTPLIGRARECALLVERMEMAVHGGCQLVLVAGNEGFGKTRLLDAFENLADRQGIESVHGRFADLDQALPYNGYLEAIQDYLRMHPDASAAMADLTLELVKLFPMMAEVDTIPGTVLDARFDAIGSRVRPIEDQTAVFETLAGALARIAGGKPLVILLEDLHGADLSIEALHYIVRRLVLVPLLIVGTYRPGDVPSDHALARLIAAMQGDRRFAAIHLGPLSEDETTALISAQLGGARVDATLARMIHEVTEGNPHFTCEIVRELVATERMVRDESGTWDRASSTTLLADSLPKTAQEAAQHRLAHLSDSARDLLANASVLGKLFEYRDLEMLVPDRHDLEEVVEALVTDGFLVEDARSREDRLVFASGVLREVLYGGLTRRRRRALHRRYAEALEQREARLLDRVLPQLVTHYGLGDVGAKVVEHAIHLSRKALASFSPEEAARAARMALEFLDGDDADRAAEGEARELLARALGLEGNHAAALEELEAAVEAFSGAGMAERSVETIALAAETAWELRRVEEAQRWVTLGLEVTREGEPDLRTDGPPSEAPASESRKRLLSLGATIANLGGDHELARTYLERVETMGRSGGDDAGEFPPGGRLVVALSGEAVPNHPVHARSASGREVCANVFETLVTTDGRGVHAPWACEHWEARDAGMSFVVSLRGGVRLHDGRVLTAELARAAFEESIARAGAEQPAAFSAIRGVSEFLEGGTEHVDGLVVESDRHLHVHLARALPIFPALLTDPRTAIACPRAGAADAPPVGTGPFQIASHEADAVVLRRHEGYWREPASRVDAVEFRSVQTSRERVEGVRMGAIDMAAQLEPKDLDELLGRRGTSISLLEAPRQTTCLLLFNSRSPVARSSGALRALAGAVDRQDLVRGTLGPLARPADGLIPPGILGHDAGRRRRRVDPTEAAETIRASGLSLPVRLRAAVHPDLAERLARLLGELVDRWSDLGVEVSVAAPAATPFSEVLERPDGMDLVVIEQNADYADPDCFAYGLFHSRAGALREYYGSPALDELIEAARNELHPKARAGLYREIEEHLLESGLMLPLFHDVDYRVAGGRVKGAALGSQPPFVNYRRVARIDTAKRSSPRREPRGVVHVASRFTHTTLDPHLPYSVADVESSLTVFETLMRAGEGTRIVPWLAAGMETEAGGRRYRFRLKENVRFHDGRRMTARDVRYSFERRLASESQFRWSLASIRGAERIIDGTSTELEGFRIESPTEFTVELVQPLAIFPALLSNLNTAIVPEHTEAIGESWATGCAGTGPFRVVGWEAGKTVELEANPDYWRHGLPRCDRLVFQFGVSSDEMTAALREGRISIGWRPTLAETTALLKEPDLEIRFHDQSALTTYFAVFNLHRGPLMDEHVRRRVAGILTASSDMFRRHFGRTAAPARSLIPPGLLGHEPWVDEPETTLELTSKEDVEVTAAVLAGVIGPVVDELVERFREHGIEFRVVNETAADFESARQAASADLYIGGWLCDYPDSDGMVYPVLHSEAGYYGRILGTPEIDRLCEWGRAETNPDLRHAIYRQIEETIARRALLVPLFYSRESWFVRPEIGGAAFNLFQPYVSYEKLFIRPS